MECDNCNSKRIVEAGGKCSDSFSCSFEGLEHDGYVPSTIGIGGGDYMEISYCADCGKIQGQFPIEIDFIST